MTFSSNSPNFWRSAAMLPPGTYSSRMLGTAEGRGAADSHPGGCADPGGSLPVNDNMEFGSGLIGRSASGSQTTHGSAGERLLER